MDRTKSFVPARYPTLFILLSTVMVLSSGLRAQTDETLNLTVRDGFTEEPIAGVLVQLRQDGLTLLEATTDPIGRANFSVTVVAAEADVPQPGHALGSPYPNPTNARVSVPLTAERAGLLTATVYDALGRVVASLDRRVAPGNFAFEANLAGLAPGSYFLAVRHNGLAIGTAPLFLNEPTQGVASILLSQMGLVPTNSSASKSDGGSNEYAVRFVKDGFVEQNRTITLPDDLTLDAWLHINPSAVALNGLAAYETDDPDIPLVIAHEDGTVVIALGDSSNAERLVGAVFARLDTTMTVVFGKNSRPERAFVEGYLILFMNYRRTVVDLGIIPPEGEPLILRDVETGDLFDQRIVAKLVGAQEWLRAASIGLSVAACAARTAATSTEAICGSSALEQARLVASQSDSPTIRASGAALGVLGGAPGGPLGCVHGPIADCYLAAADIVVSQQEAFAIAEKTKTGEIDDLLNQLTSSTGRITQIVGPQGDGAGNALRGPWSIATDGSGNAFVAGWISDNAFKITPEGTITRIVGPAGDGAGHTLRQPTWIATDGAGNVYVAGGSSDNVLKIAPGGTISEIIGPAGNGAGGSLDGAFGIAADRSDNIFVTGRYSDNVFRITPGGTITQIIDQTGDRNGNILDGPWGVATDDSDNVFVTGWRSKNVFKITPGGAITQIVDQTGDGAGNELIIPRGIGTDRSGNVYVAGFASHNVFEITPGGTITQIIDQSGDRDGNALSGPNGIATDGSGNVYVAGWLSRNAFKITTRGTITQIIDQTGDGAGHFMSSPTGIATDRLGNVFIAGEFSHNVFRITASITEE